MTDIYHISNYLSLHRMAALHRDRVIATSCQTQTQVRYQCSLAHVS